MKRVSFSVAKALKEVGYPQGVSGKFYVLHDYVDIDSNYHSVGKFVDYYDYTEPLADAPYVMEAWLWLWREKNIKINILKTHPSGSTSIYTDTYSHTFKAEDPEEAIEKAIEYLVKHNLIK